jgi:hypothetical protein
MSNEISVSATEDKKALFPCRIILASVPWRIKLASAQWRIKLASGTLKIKISFRGM